MAIIKPKSSSHWYKIGEPVGLSYSAIQEDDCTLRDFRKNTALLPSVTTIDKEKANPQLDAWIREQLLLAAMTLPEIPGESLDDRIKRIIADGETHSREAGEKGETIHALLERFNRGIKPDLEQYEPAIADGVIKTFEMMSNAGAISEFIEQPFASIDFGYACRPDWIGTLDGVKSLIDYKSQGTKPGHKVTFYDSFPRQLASNGMAAPYSINRHISIVISTTEPGRVEWKDWEPDEISHHWDVFYHLLQVFTLSRKMGKWNPESMRYE